MDALNGFGLLLVDDHPLFREGLALALRQRAPGLRVTGVACTSEALALLEQQADIDLVLLDWHLPGENGLVGAARLRAAQPAVACALMSGFDEPELPARARAAGLAGYFPKSLEVEQMLAGLARLADGGTAFERVDGASSGGACLLTERQQQIVQLAARGASNKAIAQALGIAPHTVKNHLAQIFNKLGASNRAQAVLLAYARNERDGS